MPEISTGCLLSAMFVDVIRASIHDRDTSLSLWCFERVSIRRTDMSKELDEVAESLGVCLDGGTGCVERSSKVLIYAV